jgi:peptide/nickel transport system permease protein
MLRFVLRRVAASIPVLALVSLMSFAIIWLVPGDASAILLDASATPEAIERIRRELALDQPILVQMAQWYGRILQGDLGQSILLNRSVTAAIIERLPVTLALAGMGLVFAVLLGLVAGVTAAVRHNRWADQSIMILALLGLSLPEFWLGLILIYGFAVKLGWFPSGGYVEFATSPVGWLRSMALPAFTLAIVHIGIVARMTRSSMLEVLNQDFVRTADAKGLPHGYVVLRHALPNALVPIVTIVGIIAGSMLGGAVVVEQVFALPGVGRLIIGAILSRDFPVVQGGLLFLAVIYLFVNLVVDVVYAAVDPRVRLE